MSDGMIIAIITGLLSLIGVILSNVATYNHTISIIEKAQAVTDERIEQLTRVVKVHNSVVERTYALESTTKLLDEKIKVANHRIEDLERGAS